MISKCIIRIHRCVFLSKKGEFLYATCVHIILYILTLFTYVE